MKKFCSFYFFFFIIITCKSQAQIFNEKIFISSGVYLSTMSSGFNRLNYTPYPYLVFSKDIINKINGIISIELDYLRKGGNEGLLVIDTTVWQSFYGDNLKYLKLDYLGLGLAYRHSIFRSVFYYSIGFKINYLFSGKKYDYFFDYKNYKLTTIESSIFDSNSFPYYKDKVVKFEKSISFSLIYKFPFVRKTYITCEYDMGLTSVFLLEHRINHGIQFGIKACL